MLARITYLLVIVALGCLIGGFFTRESNVLLFISIAFPRLATDWRHRLAGILAYVTLGVSGLGVLVSLSAGTPGRCSPPHRGASA